MIEDSRLKDYRPANASFYQNNGHLMVSRVGEATRCVQGVDTLGWFLILGAHPESLSLDRCPRSRVNERTTGRTGRLWSERF
jgi:hypothetical protein